MSLRDEQQRAHQPPGTSFEDFTRARNAFFETLRRDSEFRRIVASWDRPAPDEEAPRRRPLGGRR
jgi:hypothetical protein